MNLDWPTINQVLIYIIIPFGVWIVMAIYDLRQKLAVSEEKYNSIKEDIKEIKENIRHLVDLQLNSSKTKTLNKE